MRTRALAQLAERPEPDGVPVREQRQVLALDDKTVRAAPRSRPAPSPAARPAATPAAGIGSRIWCRCSTRPLAWSSDRVAVAAKSNEIAAFTTVLDELDLTEVLITADAAHTNRNHADYLHQRGGHYLWTAKLNQPTLLRRLRTLPWKQIGVAARERGRGHGRVETRTISVVSLRPCPDLRGEFFPRAADARWAARSGPP